MVRTLFAALAALALSASPLNSQSAQSGSPPPASLQPGDVVRVEIWREEDLSGEFLVSERGVVTLPLLGDRQVTGIPVDRLRDILLEEYRVQLRNPSISITPLRRIHVLGEVNKPGIYTVDPTISLAGAIATASGATSLGDLRRIRITRAGQVILNRVAVEASLQTVDVRSGDQIIVGRRGWLDRNSPLLVGSALSIVTSVVTTLILVQTTR